MDINQFLISSLFPYMLVFVRLGSMFMFLPGFSGRYVPPRIRLGFALLLMLVVTPLLEPRMPAMPEGTGTLVFLILIEALIGIFLALFAQFVLSALSIAGMSISRDVGLMSAMAFDPITDSQGAVLVTFLTFTALVLTFALDVHHLLIEALVASYLLFPVGGETFIMSDVLALLTNKLDDAFLIGLQISSPFLVFNLVFQILLGLLARLSPQLNVLFVALPLQILVGMAILAVSLPAMMFVFMAFYENSLMGFFPGL